MAIKLIKACKELNIGMSTAIEFGRKHGYTIAADPNARIDDDLYSLLAESYNPRILKRTQGLQKIQTIGFKNFRRFETFPELKLGNITYFVGGNNAGKSTVVKALLLVLENLKYMQLETGDAQLALEIPFRFEGIGIPDVHIGDFATAINANVKNNKDKRHVIVFYLTLDNFSFKIHIADTNESLAHKKYEDNSHVVISKIEVENINDHAAFVVDMLSQKVKFIGSSKLDASQEKEKQVIEDTIAQLQKQIDALQPKIELVNNTAMAAMVLHAEKDALNGKLEASKKRLKEITNISAYTKTQDLNINTTMSNSNALVKIIRGFADDLAKKTGGSLAIESQVNYIKEISKDIDAILSSIAVEYLPAHMAYQRTFFKISEQDYMSQVISDYAHARIRKGDRENIFCLKWLGEPKQTQNQDAGLGICTDYQIPSIAGEAYRVDVTTLDGIQTRLADLGMGSIQMFILLLRLATIMRKYSLSSRKPIIFIEEPELNLHPNWQSKLAEIFRDMNNYGFQIVIETHSEYLIRKSQVLVANMHFVSQEDLDENCPFKVYYFGENDYTDMRYRIDGKFENSFDTGFFDEASNLAFDIM